MANKNNNGVEKEDLSSKALIRTLPEDREIYRLLLFYKQFIELLDTFFSGYLIISDEEINRYYLRLCNKIKNFLEKPGFENLKRLNWCLFDNLRSLDPDCPEVEWEYGGQQICGNFLSAIEELYIESGEKICTLDKQDQELLVSCQTYLEKYRDYKKYRDKRWIESMKKQAEIWKKETETQKQLPQLDFNFISDTKIKILLVSDWEEAKKSFKNDLNKSTVVLCGTILEALLIDALSCIEKDAKSIYYRKYLQGKDNENKPQEIEKWLLYQLIEIAKEQGIINQDVAKLSHIVKDYRNLIHLYVQKKEQLNTNPHIASVVINLLTIAYNNIIEWHDKRKDT